MFVQLFTRAAVAALLVATAATQNFVYIPVGGTDAGTAGNDLFLVDEGGDAVAHLNGGSDAVFLMGGPVFGGSADVQDCVGDDYVNAINGRWDLVEADFDDLLDVEAFDAVHLRDWLTGAILILTGEEYWEWFQFYHGVYPWEVDPYDVLDWPQPMPIY